MHKPSPRFSKINDNHRWLLIEIRGKYIMTSKSSPDTKILPKLT